MVTYQPLEVLITILVVSFLFSLGFIHLYSMDVLLMNKKVDREIISLLLTSEKVMNSIEVDRLGVKAMNVVDCSRILCNEVSYIRCGEFRCGKRDGMVVKRVVMYNGRVVELEVGQ